MKLVLTAFVLAVVVLVLVLQPSARALGGTLTPSPSPFQVRSAAFYGLACADSDCLTRDRQVVAKVSGVECASTTTGNTWSDGQDQSYYRIEVPPEADVAGCGTEGATVDFYIDGRKANQTGIWANGSENPLAIWVGPDFALFGGQIVCGGSACYSCWQSCYGSLVEAFIGGQLCGAMSPYGSLLTGGYGPLVVKSEEAQPGCGTPGATVTFKVSGEDAAQTAEWNVGFFGQNLNTGTEIWGDNDCSGTFDGRDMLTILRVLSQQHPPPPICFNPLESLAIVSSSIAVKWADIDCSGDLTVLDAIRTLQAVAAISILQAPGCPSPGATIQAYPQP